MLSELCVRPRHWQLTSLSLSYAHGSAYDRTPAQPFPDRIDHSINTHPHRCGASSVWHAIIPSVWRQRRRRTAAFDGYENEALRRCEGSWNVAWDARPARWLHHPDLVWLIFGVCTGLATPLPDSTADSDSIADFDDDVVVSDTPECGRSNYRVTGVAADGRCLFRAIAHMSCLIDGENIPDENRQTELADELRAQVVEELLKRRKEVQWFIEEDFDVYVKRIQQPYVWGGEPELLMSSHVLRKPISVFMAEKSTGDLIKIADYGEQYKKDEENPINVLFHGYGHYDILEALSVSRPKEEA
ncbi:uncharacterized protein [Primulina eburnea]|uniref:uncharacterized protein n=1 Tax=Primulina eburnea TaxID=1245227 RepID=UPI003C6C2E4C